jgi:DNA-binding response OmpR family regulator
MTTPVPKILVTDDDDDARRLLAAILRGAGFEVREAPSGEEALKVLGEGPFDLLVLDRSMPGLSGLDVLRALKERHVKIKTLIISAYGEEELWAEAFALGALDYLLKPYSPNHVLGEIKKTLAKEIPK